MIESEIFVVVKFSLPKVAKLIEGELFMACSDDNSSVIDIMNVSPLFKS